MNCSSGSNIGKIIIFACCISNFALFSLAFPAASGLIKDIRIDNAYPLFEREILNVMSISVGIPFAESELSKQEAAIEKLYLKEGFVNPNVRLSADSDPKDGNHIVNVIIERGEYYRLESVEINGNRAFSDAMLKLRLKTWQKTLMLGQSRRFIEAEVKQDVKNLTEYYRQKHYPDANIAYSLRKDAESLSVSVIIKISEGRRYDFEFEGGKAFWDMTLKKDLILFEEGNEKDSGLKNSLEKIRERYRKAGYLRTTVKSEERKVKNEGLRKIVIRIDEGPRSVVEDVRISGNTAFAEKKIKKQLLTTPSGIWHDGAYIPDVLEEDLNAIASLYLTQGYTDANAEKKLEWHDPCPSPERGGEFSDSLSSPKRGEESSDSSPSPCRRGGRGVRSVSVGIAIEEGVRTLISTVEITGLRGIDKDEAFGVIQSKPGDPFRQYMIKSDENSLSSLISEKGYPHVRVNGNVVFSEDKSHAEVNYVVEQGYYTAMGSIRYSGNFLTRERILDNEVEMKPHDPFSLKKMLKTQQNFRNMEIFDSVQFRTTGLKEKAEEVGLLVEMEEKKPYYLQFGGGYDTDRNFYLQTKAGNRNLLGLNKNASIGGEVSEIGYRADAGITEPRLFGSRISSNLSIFSELKEEFNQEFGISSHGASLGFERKLLEKLRLGLNFRFERRHQYLTDPDSVPSLPGDYDIRTLLAVTPSVSFDTRDSFIRPRKGFLTSVSADVSKGIDNTIDDFVKYRFDARAYLTPAEKLTFALRTQIGYIDPYNSDEKVPTDQLFFLGGTSNIRGYDENLLRYDLNGKPLGGRTSILGSLEARYDLGMNFEMTLFYDIGKVDHIDYDTDTGIRSTTGFGLRYITPIGPIGFLYGIKLDPMEGESRGRFHFSMGYTF